MKITKTTKCTRVPVHIIGQIIYYVTDLKNVALLDNGGAVTRRNLVLDSEGQSGISHLTYQQVNMLLSGWWGTISTYFQLSTELNHFYFRFSLLWTPCAFSNFSIVGLCLWQESEIMLNTFSLHNTFVKLHCFFKTIFNKY
jgi:hypothetical protein